MEIKETKLTGNEIISSNKGDQTLKSRNKYLFLKKYKSLVCNQ